MQKIFSLKRHALDEKEKRKVLFHTLTRWSIRVIIWTFWTLCKKNLIFITHKIIRFIILFRPRVMEMLLLVFSRINRRCNTSAKGLLVGRVIHLSNKVKSWMEWNWILIVSTNSFWKIWPIYTRVALIQLNPAFEYNLVYL